MIDPMADHDLESVDLNAGSPQWALMALDPSGKRQLMVKELGSGHQGTAVLFREHGGGRLSVLKWNRAAYNEERMARRDREARVARLLSSSERAARFARLLSSQDMVGGYRQSWWEFYNVGSMQGLSMAILEESNPPFSLVFRIVRQCLEGIQSLGELNIFHMDLHTGNVFLHLPDGASYPDAVIGDFGYSRLPGEGPPEFTAWEWSLMNSTTQAGRSSPPLTYGDSSGHADRSWRLPWDLEKFRYNASEDFLDNLDKDDERNQLTFSLFNRMAGMCKQDEIDRKLPEAERPPLQDLTQMIQDAKTLERLYAATASDKQALGELRQKLLDLLSEEPVDPLVFEDEQAARDDFGIIWMSGCSGWSTWPTRTHSKPPQQSSLRCVSRAPHTCPTPMTRPAPVLMTARRPTRVRRARAPLGETLSSQSPRTTVVGEGLRPHRLVHRLVGPLPRAALPTQQLSQAATPRP